MSAAALSGLFLILGMLAAGSGKAVEVSGLFEAEVPVADREQTAREEAFLRAFNTVLVRLTGSSSVADRAQEAVGEARDYVQQYQYREDEEGYALWVRFDGQTLEDAVRSAGLPIWGSERPAVLIWLAVDQEDRRYLIGEEGSGNARSILEAEAQARGLPLMYPLMDLEDRQRVNIADVMGGFDDTALRASRRYGPDVVVVAQAQASDGGFWRSHWRLYYGGQEQEWSSQGESLPKLLTENVDTLADALAAQLAIDAGTQARNTLRLDIIGVDSLEDYAFIEQYLASLAPVSGLQTARVTPDSASFDVRLSGDARDLERVIALDGSLEKAESLPPYSFPRRRAGKVTQEFDKPALRYRLLQ